MREANSAVRIQVDGLSQLKSSLSQRQSWSQVQFCQLCLSTGQLWSTVNTVDRSLLGSNSVDIFLP